MESERRVRWYHLITVEPPMFFYMMAYMLTSVIEQTFYFQRSCLINHNLTEEICSNLSSYNDLNNQVQVTVSNFQQWNGIAGHVVPFILAFFLGSWSDKHGRKSLLLAGFLGKLYFSLAITVNALNDWPVEYVIYTATLPSALSGADLAIFTGCFAYIADVSTRKNRTLRVGILDAVYLSTMPTGVYIGRILWANGALAGSFPAMFGLNSAFMLIACVYAGFALKWQTRPEQMSLKDAGVTSPIRDFFNIKHLNHSLLTLFRKRLHHKTLYLWFLLASMALYTCQRDERPMMYLYTMKVFNWGNAEFSNFRAYLSTAYVLVMLAGIPFMTRFLHLRDTVIVMLGATAHMGGHFIYAQARVDKTFYVGATVAALGPCVAPLIRSMTSKLLPTSERGVAFAFLSVMENAVAMFASVIYSQIYNATIHMEYPTAIFYFTFGTQAVVFLLALTIHIMLRGRQIDAEDNAEETESLEPKLPE